MNSIITKILGVNPKLKSAAIALFLSVLIMTCPWLLNWLPEDTRKGLFWCADLYLKGVGAGLIAWFSKQANVTGNGTVESPFEKAVKDEEGDKRSTVIPLIILFAGIGIMIFSTGCELTEVQKSKWSATGSVLKRQVTNIAINTVLNAATSQLDREKKENFLHSAATGLRTEMLTVVNSNDIAEVIKIWTPEPNHWKTLAAQVATVYEQADPKTDAERTRVIEAIARGLQDAAK